ncbi:MAG TPA: response regulator [Isosphaeraceae bacterium]|jgi:CheY-like chemotaxis protein|nr:response regulator [Isosphaeraceae bacterium]
MRPEFHILLVEDSETDAKIIDRALREAKIKHRLTVIRNGRQALDYLVALTDPGTSADLEPDLVLLDLNLPGLDGYQLLTRVKSDPVLRVLPIVVLSTSNREEDVLQSYQAGANTFIQKPGEYPRYRELVVTLRRYWYDTAHRLPRNRPRG